ncbi:hypothetical protein ASF60_18050 [Methylobacterium sp. Leaf113]|uniref:hypothetical protein n=1 Tax=Methylobacterium sp. Leaf113 TaxID=1736259 RepID=UPI00070140EE|nr:hypothetical protein [Methylobacterium sp. Leaf113]KQP91347.1 hypothetical protein ASF60_18050 [Methylobacterium sp. Leaf113]
MTNTAALTRPRAQAEAAVAEAKVAAQAVLAYAPGTDTPAVTAARTAATRASRLALLMIEQWLEHERDRADEALLGEGDAEACHAILNFEF